MDPASDAMLRDELRVAGLDLPDSDVEALYPLWRENLERRSAMRSTVLDMGELQRAASEGAPAPPRAWQEGPADPGAAPKAGTPGTDVVHATIQDLAELIRTRRISSVELTTAYLRQIERLDARTRAFVSLLADEALRTAAACDESLGRGEWLGPLHGIPIALKDNIAISGVRLTGGSRSLAANIAGADATVAANLRRAGAVILGTNTLLEFGLGPAIADGPFCTGINPWDPSRSTGGSSSGSAVAVVAGLCAGAVCTDTAGSVRLPASICGAVGFKPTNGLVDMMGILPMSWSLCAAGPLTRSVDDAGILLEAMLGPQAAAGAGIDGTAVRRGLMQGLRVGVLRHDFVDRDDVQPAVRAAIDDAERWFRASGCSVEDVVIPGLQNNEAIYATHMAETFAVHRDALQRNPDGYHQKTRIQIYLGALVSADDWFRAGSLRRRLTADVLSLMHNVDVLLMPGQGTTAGAFDAGGPPALMKSRSRFTRAWNMVGTPAVVLPAGYGPDGLPISLQLVARPWEDGLLLRVAAALEMDALPRRRLPPVAAAAGSGSLVTG
jgi:aspartyl-tRNA(Asn)/glutamyl-tRNA(Gln) amidotransferase subunit A